MKKQNWSRILTVLFIAFAALAATAAPVGVTVNNTPLDDTFSSNGTGWEYAPSTCILTLDGAAPVTLAGVNTNGKVRVVVPEGVTNTVTLLNLTLQTIPASPWDYPPDNVCAFALEANASVSLFLAGKNLLESTSFRAGLEVPAGASLSITNAPGRAIGSLVATGGSYGAGIGSGGGYSYDGGDCGTVTISGGTVTATGGGGGAGIGGGWQGAGGTVAIYGGRVTATGGMNFKYSGAGIGGGYQGAGGTVAIYGGRVTATGGRCGAGIGGGYNADGGTVNISGGRVTATGGISGAGIGGGSGAGGTVSISGGTVDAQGGDYGAGIGGGSGGAGGTVSISGGTVFAHGGNIGGAGIGGGSGEAGGTVTISGGVIFAQGNRGGAGIGGGGDGGAGGTVTISDGTVAAQGDDGGADVGPGYDGTVAGANTFTGGSIRLGASSASLVPSNGTVQVGCAMVPGFEPYELVEITDRGNLPAYYVTSDIYADGDGCIYLWLPDGDYHFTANGRDCMTEINDGAGPTGVTVNGEEAAFGPANPATAGWSFDAANRTVRLSGAGAFTLAGVNLIGGVRIAVPAGVTNTVTLSNLTLRATGNQQCAFALGESANVSLFLAGTSTLASGYGHAGLEIAAGQTLSITNAPGDDAGSLTATGGSYGAGIGGGYNADGGTVTISGGRITAIGGRILAAGIGGGYQGAGGTVTISGGQVTATGADYGAGIGTGGYSYDGGDCGTVTISGGQVTAIGGSYGAGVGGGYTDAGGTVAISGGTVTAVGGSDDYGIGGGAGIGGGWQGAGGTVAISGGTVTATGGCDAEDIGHGNGATSSGANTFTGGSIRLANMTISPVPYNGTAQVACAVVAGFAPGAPVVFTASPGSGLPSDYGTNDITADAYGCIYLWLSGGHYEFMANGRVCAARVDKNFVGSSGVTINGEDVAFEPAAPDTAGWSRASGSPVISGDGPFTISGGNVLGQVSIGITDYNSPSVTLSNLTIRSTSEAPIVVNSQNVSLFLAGTNTLASDTSHAGLELRMGSSVSIDSAAGVRGVLHATGGSDSPGIGSVNGGMVMIYGGEIHATGGINGAGIGGDGGDLTVRISGGTLFAAGDAANGAPDIGFREGSSFSCANTFAGGSIRLANNWISAAPENNNMEPVWCMAFPGFTPGAAAPVIDGLPDGYGINDLFADEDGKLYLWLPADDYLFTINGLYYVATIVDEDAAATGQHFSIDSFELADGNATFTLVSRLPQEILDKWIKTVSFEVQYCTNLTEGSWTALPGTVQRDGMTLTLQPFTPPDSPRVFLRVSAQQED